jgi:hypothetical protein
MNRIIIRPDLDNGETIRDLLIGLQEYSGLEDIQLTAGGVAVPPDVARDYLNHVLGDGDVPDPEPVGELSMAEFLARVRELLATPPGDERDMAWALLRRDVSGDDEIPPGPGGGDDGKDGDGKDGDGKDGDGKDGDGKDGDGADDPQAKKTASKSTAKKTTSAARTRTADTKE